MVIDNSRGRIRIKEFHLVQTSLGTMLEPRSISPQIGDKGATFLPDGEMAFIDDIVFIDNRERYQVQNPVYYGDATNWSCIHDLQLGPAIQGYGQYGRHFRGA
jgi:hypothetical protein